MYLAMWVDANSDKPVGDSDLAELYPDIYWCNHCEDHPLTLVETTVKEKPFNKPNVRQPCGHDGYKEVDGKPTCVYCGEEFEL